MERKINSDLAVNEVVSGCTHVLSSGNPFLFSHFSPYSIPFLFFNSNQSLPFLLSVPAARHNFPISYSTFSSTFVFSVYLILKCM